MLHVGALRRVVLHSEEAPARIAEANRTTLLFQDDDDNDDNCGDDNDMIHN